MEERKFSRELLAGHLWGVCLLRRGLLGLLSQRDLVFVALSFLALRLSRGARSAIQGSISPASPLGRCECVCRCRGQRAPKTSAALRLGWRLVGVAAEKWFSTTEFDIRAAQGRQLLANGSKGVGDAARILETGELGELVAVDSALLSIHCHSSVCVWGHRAPKRLVAQRQRRTESRSTESCPLRSSRRLGVWVGGPKGQCRQ